MKTATLNGKNIAYFEFTEFKVQIGKGRKGSYKTVASFTGDFGAAFMRYQMLNVGNGFKKRLIMPSSRKAVIHKVTSA